MASKMTAGIVKRVLKSDVLQVVDVEQYLYGARGDHMSERLLEHRNQNTVKAISRARKFLIVTFGPGNWLVVNRARNGRFVVRLKAQA